MNNQTAFFELGDSAGDELARTSEDGATWTEPSLFQQGRPAIAAELESDARAAELIDRHRATIGAHPCHFCADEPCAIPDCHREELPIMGHGPNGPVRYGRHQL